MYTPKTILYILIKFTLCNASSSSDTNTLCDSIKNHQNVSDEGVIILKSEENHVYLSRTENNFSFSRKCHSTGKLEKEIISQVSSKCTKQHNEQIISDLLLYMPKFTTQSSVPIVCAVFEGLQQCPSHLVFELKFHAFEFTIFNIHSDCTSQTQHILRTDSEFKISQTFYGIWRIFDFCMGILTLLLIFIFLLINWRTLALKLQNTRCTFLFYIVFTACHVWNISILVSVTTYQNIIGQQSIYNFKELLDFQIRQPNNTPFTTYFKLKAKTPPTMFNSKLKQAEHSIISNIYENDNTLVFDENDTQVMNNSLLKLIGSDGMDSHSTNIISNHIKIYTRLDFIFKLSLVCIYILFSFTIIHFAVTQIPI